MERSFRKWLRWQQLADRFAKIEAQFAERADAAATATATGTATPAARTAAHGQTRPKEEGLSGSTDPLSVHDIVRRYTESCVIKHFDHLSAQVLSTLVRLGFCRTADLGSRDYQCNGCSYGRTVYNLSFPIRNLATFAVWLALRLRDYWLGFLRRINLR